VDRRGVRRDAGRRAGGAGVEGEEGLTEREKAEKDAEEAFEGDLKE